MIRTPAGQAAIWASGPPNVRQKLQVDCCTLTSIREKGEKKKHDIVTKKKKRKKENKHDKNHVKVINI